MPPLHACRFNPPTAAPVIAHTDKGPVVLGWASEHVPVTPDMWCGQHKRGVLTSPIGGDPIRLPEGLGHG